MTRGADQPRRQIPAGIIEEDAPSSVPGEEDAGAREAQQLTRGLAVRDLKREADEADHQRSEKFKDQFELMALFSVWVLFVGFMGFGGVWVFHQLLPARGWLSPTQIADIQSLLTGGIITGLVADHVRKRMS